MTMHYQEQIDEEFRRSIDLDEESRYNESNPKDGNDDINKVETSYWQMFKASWCWCRCCQRGYKCCNFNCNKMGKLNDEFNIFELIILWIVVIIGILYLAYAITGMPVLLTIYCSGDVSTYPTDKYKTQIVKVNNSDNYVYIPMCEIDEESDGMGEQYCYNQLCLVTNNSTNKYGVYRVKIDCKTLNGMEVGDTITVYFNDAMVNDGVVSVCPLDEKSPSYYTHIKKICYYIGPLPFVCVGSFIGLMLGIFVLIHHYKK